jgi:hypothetical protein
VTCEGSEGARHQKTPGGSSSSIFGTQHLMTEVIWSLRGADRVQALGPEHLAPCPGIVTASMASLGKHFWPLCSGFQSLKWGNRVHTELSKDDLQQCIEKSRAQRKTGESSPSWLEARALRGGCSPVITN